MHQSLRRFRGVLGTAVTWGFAWGALGSLAGVPQWTVVGFTSGAGFALALALAERRSRADTLALRRTALWGALGAVAGASVAVPWLWAMSHGALRLVPFLGVSALLGAGSAAGTLLLIRRADAGPRLTAGDRPCERATLGVGHPGGSVGAAVAADASTDREAAT